MQVRNKIRVVIADRDLFYLQKLKLCLERRGDMVVVGMADNGPAVFQMVQESAPDVLLMDVILGEKDGVWVLEQMKAQKKECVCIMISAIDSDTVVRRAVAMGADYYMAKPIQGELLLERIHQLTEPIRSYEGKKRFGQYNEKNLFQNTIRYLDWKLKFLLCSAVWGYLPASKDIISSDRQ